MKIFKILSIGILLGTLGVSCSKDFLEYEPEGLLSSSNVATADNAEALVTAAYAGIANDDMIGPITGMWAYGSVRSDDSYKGGGGVGDVDVVDHMEQFYQVKADMSWWLPNTWTNHYKAISRTNFALKVINDIEDAEYSNKTLRTAELRFLRAHSHFMLKILFDKVPYITEDLTQEEIMQTGNDLSNDELWGKGSCCPTGSWGRSLGRATACPPGRRWSLRPGPAVPWRHDIPHFPTGRHAHGLPRWRPRSAAVRPSVRGAAH